VNVTSPKFANNIDLSPRSLETKGVISPSLIMSSPIVMKEHKFNIVADGKKSGLSKNGFEQSN